MSGVYGQSEKGGYMAECPDTGNHVDRIRKQTMMENGEDSWSTPGRPDRGEEPFGNNLSHPVIWSDGVAKELRGQVGLPTTGGDFTVIDGVTYWHQQDQMNTWQAQSLFVDPTVPDSEIYVDLVDWGDVLEAKPWSVNSKVRVETTLYENVVAMYGNDMMKTNDLTGPGEMWGADLRDVANDGGPTTTFSRLFSQANIYSHAARLTIQKIDPNGNLVWDENLGQWTGDGVLGTFFNGAVWEADDGPGFYSSEINVPGKIIYGYNWDVKTTGDGVGTYRLTFSFDEINYEAATGNNLNTFFNGTETCTLDETGTCVPIVPGEDEEQGGGVAVIDPENNLTYIDVQIESERGGRRGPGGGGGGPS